MNDTKTCKVCDVRKAHHGEGTKRSLINRLNRVEGQVRGIKKMIEEDVYCDDILNQITSIRSALIGVGNRLLEEHIRTCVKDQLAEGKDAVIEELTATIRRMLK